MKRVAEALTVSRSRLTERLKEPTQGRPPRYSKAEDEVLLPLIRDIIDHRLTYGYRRVCAVLKRRLKQEGHAGVIPWLAVVVAMMTAYFPENTKPV